ncbi:hypothetical protein [Parasitella parasitica]|uniref:Histone deacetylase interacting domain-containing protein n=1 Tax=Parasitella parasitica TaxID=35722 RepID=A0A0B7NP85_9FUNG|nr:hypothetical protein [Parasitella parasitica]
MPVDSPSPKSTAEPYMSSYNSPSAPRRTLESSPYQSNTANSVHTTTVASPDVVPSAAAAPAALATSVDQPAFLRRHTSETPPPAQHSLLQQSTNAPNYAKQRTPIELSPSNAVPESVAVPTDNAVTSHQNMNASSVVAAANSLNTTNASSGYRPLNVKDALTYLDQVKMKFADQARVYNRFLDIMKEFKSQAIDTPGVIERVSTLFRGHPALISGFNTFLPPGYRIECTTDAYARDIIKVTTPTGTTSTTSGEPLNLHSENPPMYYHNNQRQQQQQQPQQQHQRSPAPAQVYPNNSYRNASGSLPPIATPYHPSQPLLNSQRSSVPPSSSSGNAGLAQPPRAHRSSSPPPPPQNSAQSDEQNSRRTPVEFNHAINYVNKIKNRFSNDPDTYKQFLEILQTYQKEQKPIQEVYAQVQTLFNGANDLLAEFKQFLPDTSQQTPIVETSKKTKKQRSLPLPKQKKAKLHHSSGGSAVSVPNKMDYAITSDIRRAPLVLPTAPVDGPVISPVEAEFFDRVKKHIGNKQTYFSFLRVLNLFTQQVLDANQLVDRCESYLSGNKDLFSQLKKLVGYDGKDRVIENVPLLSSRIEYGSAFEYGPSYRSVPKHWQSQKCSGRDSLCWEVLNDEYVSHPTWASEDGGFIASKKNVYEEALHRVEEERYHYDLDIEANLNTISLLEPINKKIALMTDDEKNDFKVAPGLGGPSKAIYQRVLKKIYGSEKGAQVVDMVHNSPAHAVPVVLKRLKQKDEEWRHLQREWNKVWREIDSKNYYKALDYQGVIFKTSDKKAMNIKQLVGEIEAIRHDQFELLEQPQLVYSFRNKKVFKDVSRVLYSYFDRQTAYGPEDCAVMKAFVEMFLPVFFDVPDVLPDKEPSQDIMLDDEHDDVDDEEDAMDQDVDQDSETHHSYDSSTEPRSAKRGANHARRNGRRSPRQKPNDEDHHKLLKDVLGRKLISVAESKAAESTIERLAAEEADDDDLIRDTGKEQKIYNLFGNTTFYCFFRLFQVCYDRLHQMKRLDRDYRTNGESAKSSTKAALDLNVSSKEYNNVHMDFKRGYYHALLSLIDRYFDDAFDQTVFEECTRYIFGNKAYVLFTMDKLMQSIMRQLHHIVTDSKAQTILSLFKKNHEHEKSTPRLIQAYRSQVTEALGEDDKLYNLAFDTLNRSLYIQLLEKGDKAFGLNDVDVYTDYVAKYTNWAADTPGVDQNKLQKSFLGRNIQQVVADDSYSVQSSLAYKICRNTYHLFYVVPGEDAFVRAPVGSSDCAAQNDTARSTAWKSWLAKKRGTSELDDKTRSLLA